MIFILCFHLTKEYENHLKNSSKMHIIQTFVYEFQFLPSNIASLKTHFSCAFWNTYCLWLNILFWDHTARTCAFSLDSLMFLPSLTLLPCKLNRQLALHSPWDLTFIFPGKMIVMITHLYNVHFFLFELCCWYESSQFFQFPCFLLQCLKKKQNWTLLYKLSIFTSEKPNE